MENLSPEGNAPATGSTKESSTKKTSAEKKPTLSSPISQKQSEIASKIAQPSILERLTGERATAEPKLETKPELALPTMPPEVAEHARPVIAAQAEAAFKPESTEAEAQFVEIPLGDVRSEAAKYIDLHQQALAEAKPSAENKADSALLEQAAEDVQAAQPETSFKEVIDDAYDQTVTELRANPENFGPPAAAATSAETSSYVSPTPDVAEQAHRQAAAETPASPNALVAPTQAETAPTTTEDTSTAVPWYYHHGAGRRFYPGTWSPRSPEKTLVDKVSEKARARRQRRAIERRVDHKLDQNLERQTEAVQRYIDRKEQAIRNEATNLAAVANQALPAAPEQGSSAYPTTRAVPEQVTFAAAAARPLLERAPQVPAAAVTEQVSSYVEQRSPQTAERVQRLDRRELLATAEKIIVDGTSIRAIYESKRISEEGMRRVITEYYRGGDIKHTLDQELMIKELSYERDPQVRNILGSRAGLQSGAKRSSDQTDKNRPATPTSDNKSDQSSASSSKSSAAEAKRPKKSTNPAEQALVRTWGIVVVILAFIAVVLLLR